MKRVYSDSDTTAWNNYRSWVRGLLNVPDPEPYENPNAGTRPWN
jgi:hypothetical protein